MNKSSPHAYCNIAFDSNLLQEMTVLHTPTSVRAVVQPYTSSAAIYFVQPDLTMTASTVGTARNYLFCSSKS